jgi:hypothetical protein
VICATSATTTSCFRINRSSTTEVLREVRRSTGAEQKLSRTCRSRGHAPHQVDDPASK